jgi:anti-sigma-K factor RskA
MAKKRKRASRRNEAKVADETKATHRGLEISGRAALNQHERLWVRIQKAEHEHRAFLWQRLSIWLKVGAAIAAGVAAFQSVDLKAASRGLKVLIGYLAGG